MQIKKKQQPKCKKKNHVYYNGFNITIGKYVLHDVTMLKLFLHSMINHYS